MLSRPGMGHASHSLISRTRTQLPDTSPSYHPCVPAGLSPRDHLTPSYPPHSRALQWQLSSDAEQLHLRHILPRCGAGLPTFPSIRFSAGLTLSMLTHCFPPVLKQGFTFASSHNPGWPAPNLHTLHQLSTLVGAERPATETPVPKGPTAPVQGTKAPLGQPFFSISCCSCNSMVAQTLATWHVPKAFVKWP